MEIKYTLEILTKDIQDIENLVAMLQNSPGDSTLEIDLALSKLRNVYDVLTSIRSEMDELRKHLVVDPDEKEAPRTAESFQESEVKETEIHEEPEAGTGRAKAMKTRGNAEILAEKFLAQASINENLATSRKPDIDARVMGKPIDSISKNIGINDRFLIIRELFDGNAEDCRQLIDQLDQAGSAESAGNLLKKRFPGEEDHDGVKILSSLVKRRYASN
jgi:hypothetical protein